MNKITEICQQYLEEEFGADTASYLTNSLYYKQVEYTDKKRKRKKKKDESAAPLSTLCKVNLFRPIQKNFVLISFKGKKNS